MAKLVTQWVDTIKGTVLTANGSVYLVEDVLNGLPAIFSDGSTGYMEGPIAAGEIHGLIVFLSSPPPSGRWALYMGGEAETPRTYVGLSQLSTGSIQANTGVGSSISNGVLTTGAHVFCLRYGPGFVSIQIDGGAEHVTTGSFTLSIDPAGVLRLFTDELGAPSGSFGVLELSFTLPLDPVTRLKLDAWLAWRGGIEALLPPPYNTMRP